MVLNSAGMEVPLAPNANFDGLQPDVQYTSISEIAAAAQPLLSLAEFTGGTVVGKTSDWSKGFRQIHMCALDRWQLVEF